MTATTIAEAGKTASRRINAAADEAIDEAAGQARKVADLLGAKAQKATDHAADSVEDLAKTVRSFAQEQPLAALAASALAGFLFAVLFVRRVPRTIYVNPNTH